MPRAPSAEMEPSRPSSWTAFAPSSRCRSKSSSAMNSSLELRAVLEELAPADREILTLRYALDYDANTIADRLEIAVTAVHMRLSRARQRLAERLTSHGDFAPSHQ